MRISGTPDTKSGESLSGARGDRLPYQQLLLSRLLLPTRRRVQRFTLSRNDPTPDHREPAGPDVSRPDARLLRDLRANHDATAPLSELVERLEGTVQRIREQTSGLEAIIAAAKQRLGE